MTYEKFFELLGYVLIFAGLCTWVEANRRSRKS